MLAEVNNVEVNEEDDDEEEVMEAGFDFTLGLVAFFTFFAFFWGLDLAAGGR